MGKSYVKGIREMLKGKSYEDQIQYLGNQMNKQLKAGGPYIPEYHEGLKTVAARIVEERYKNKKGSKALNEKVTAYKSLGMEDAADEIRKRLESGRRKK